jgi:hypothetical protein
MRYVHAGNNDHWITKISDDEYAISWTYDTKHARLRYPRRVSRITNRKGAEFFAKRWGVEMP